MDKRILKYVHATTTMSTSSFVDITSSDMDAIIQYAKQVITDLFPILQLIVAVALGIIIIRAIISAIKK